MRTDRNFLQSLFSLTIFPMVFFGISLSLPAHAADLDAYLEQATKFETVTMNSVGQRFEPQQTIAPNAPPRHVSNYDLTLQWTPKKDLVQENWQLNTIYPFPNRLKFKADYHSHGGVREGRDGFRPNLGGSISAARAGAVIKDLWLSNPLILMSHAGLGAEGFKAGADGTPFTFTAFETQWTVTLDKETNLPSKLITVESDPLEGSLVNAVTFADWRMIGDTPFPFRLEQTIGDRLIRREVRQSIVLDSDENQSTLSNRQTNEEQDNDEKIIDQNTILAERNRGWSMSHFFLRRALIGGPSDGDESANVQINSIGDGIYQIVGSSHHTIVIEGRKGLALVDAAWYPRRSKAVLAAIRKKWRRKPIKYVILTHHHIDHVGGLQTFADLGTTIVTGVGNFEYFYNILIKTTKNPPSMQPVDKRLSISGIGKTIELFDIPNSHADDMIGIYVPDSKTVINTDLYSPGRPTQQPVWASEFASAISFHGLDVERHVGSHGSGAEPHDNLVKRVSGKNK